MMAYSSQTALTETLQTTAKTLELLLKGTRFCQHNFIFAADQRDHTEAISCIHNYGYLGQVSIMQQGI